MTEEPTGYDLQSVTLPRLSGVALRLLAMLVDSPFYSLVQSSLLSKSGIKWFRNQYYNDPPTMLPIHKAETRTEITETAIPEILQRPMKNLVNGFSFNTIADYSGAYREGRITPVDVVNRLLEAVDKNNGTEKPLNAFININREDILKQAEESTGRIKQGKPLSILDGIPVPVKDQFDVKGYPTTIGTGFLGKSNAAEDSGVVYKLRSAGAIIAGKTNMHELGLGVTGLNLYHGVIRNPYNPEHYAGGSSSGSAAAPAAGLGPASIGADGGGSIRIPSSFCGLVGLKPTYGRVSLRGDAQLCWSVEHTGLLAVTAADAAIIYATIAGPDPGDTLSLRQPPVILSGWDNADLSDLTLGIYPEWFSHAEPETVAVCESLLNSFKSIGATIRNITIPGLEAGRVAHTIIIAAEIAHSMERYHAQHHRDYGLEVRLNLAMARKFTSSDYLKSQQVRTRMIADFVKAFEQVDIMLTPVTGIPAPAIPENTLPEGESDLTSLFEIMRFATPANMTGLPAISFPAGYTSSGLPVGMQAIGKAWREDIILRLALAAEKAVVRKAPMIYYDLLKNTI